MNPRAWGTQLRYRTRSIESIRLSKPKDVLWFEFPADADSHYEAVLTREHFPSEFDIQQMQSQFTGDHIVPIRLGFRVRWHGETMKHSTEFIGSVDVDTDSIRTGFRPAPRNACFARVSVFFPIEFPISAIAGPPIRLVERTPRTVLASRLFSSMKWVPPLLIGTFAAVIAAVVLAAIGLSSL